MEKYLSLLNMCIYKYLSYINHYAMRCFAFLNRLGMGGLEPRELCLFLGYEGGTKNNWYL